MTLNQVRFQDLSSGGCHALEIWVLLYRILFQALRLAKVEKGKWVVLERDLGTSSFRGWDGRSRRCQKVDSKKKAKQQNAELLISIFQKPGKKGSGMWGITELWK